MIWFETGYKPVVNISLTPKMGSIKKGGKGFIMEREGYLYI